MRSWDAWMQSLKAYNQRCPSNKPNHYLLIIFVPRPNWMIISNSWPHIPHMAHNPRKSPGIHEIPTIYTPLDRHPYQKLYKTSWYSWKHLNRFIHPHEIKETFCLLQPNQERIDYYHNQGGFELLICHKFLFHTSLLSIVKKNSIDVSHGWKPWYVRGVGTVKKERLLF